MAKLHGDDVLLWSDGTWMYRCEYYEGGGKWLSDDFKTLSVDTFEWNELLDNEDELQCPSTNTEKLQSQEKSMKTYSEQKSTYPALSLVELITG